MSKKSTKKAESKKMKEKKAHRMSRGRTNFDRKSLSIKLYKMGVHLCPEMSFFNAFFFDTVPFF